jgi:hypothetical protein
MQVTRPLRGATMRFRRKARHPRWVIMAKSTDPTIIAGKNANGIKAITVPDNRWDRGRVQHLFPRPFRRWSAIANGHPGGLSAKIREAFFDVAEKIAI